MKKPSKDLPAEEALRKQIPVALRTLRVNAGLSQQTIAQALCVSRSAYSYYELGITMPGASILYWLSLFYGVPADVFFTPDAVPNLHPNVKRVREHLDQLQKAGSNLQ